jgi:hypothetical protein
VEVHALVHVGNDGGQHPMLDQSFAECGPRCGADGIWVPSRVGVLRGDLERRWDHCVDAIQIGDVEDVRRCRAGVYYACERSAVVAVGPGHLAASLGKAAHRCVRD